MVFTEEYQYYDLCLRVLEEGVEKEDRTGVGTYSVFGHQMRFNLSKRFPLLTSKFVPLRIIAEELFWFLKGETNIRPLIEKNVHIWDDWPYDKFKKSPEYNGETMKEFAQRILEDEEFAEKWGGLGPVYGKQWRSWKGANGETIDQITNVIEQIKTNPNSRRLIVSAWKVDEIDKMALPPCHSFFQFYVANGKLSCQLYQRSGDIFLGIPFNIASYALLTMMIAQVTGLKPGEFIHTIGDAHIYKNHIEQVKTLLSRTPYEFPQVKLNPNITNIFDFKWEDIELINYNHHPKIVAEVAV